MGGRAMGEEKAAISADLNIRVSMALRILAELSPDREFPHTGVKTSGVE
jgi:hypothetical protein